MYERERVSERERGRLSKSIENTSKSSRRGGERGRKGKEKKEREASTYTLRSLTPDHPLVAENTGNFEKKTMGLYPPSRQL